MVIFVFNISPNKIYKFLNVESLALTRLKRLKRLIHTNLHKVYSEVTFRTEIHVQYQSVLNKYNADYAAEVKLLPTNVLAPSNFPRINHSRLYGALYQKEGFK